MLGSAYRALIVGLATGLAALFLTALVDISLITNAIGQNDTGVQPRHVGGKVCAACHQKAFNAWTGSDHDFALKPATGDTVFGDFEEATFEAQGITTRFFRRDTQFFVETDGPDGLLAEFEIKYAVGAENLQQYLVELNGGRLQALDIAWDTVRNRWFNLYPNQRASAGDGFHWTGPYKNWQARCAVCHQTDFHKNYDPGSRTYKSTWSEVNVQCEACHGPGEAHVQLERDPDSVDMSTFKGVGASGLTIKFDNDKPEVEIGLCATCHSRREPLDANSTVPGSKFADHYRLALLRQGLYYADGQIRDEVFVHGSFLQSKMFDRGVRCTDCHDPHSGKLVATGNAVCTQCHNVEGNTRFPTLTRIAYDSTEHHFHNVGSEAAQCTSCHMPARNFLIVDPRRDHSFRVPRPDISAKLGTPNACTTCHTNQTDEWATKQIASHRSQSRAGKPHFADSFSRARPLIGASTREELLQIAGDEAAPAIVRATALEILRSAPSPESADRTAPLLQDENALIRAAAVVMQRGSPPAVRVQRLVPILSDPVRSVRITVARELAGLPIGRLPPAIATTFATANDELRASFLARADFPETHLNIAGLATTLGNRAAAEQSLRTALQMDPQLSDAWLFLGRILMAEGRAEDAQRALEEAVLSVPRDGLLHQSLGNVYLQARQPQLALRPLRRAAELLPSASSVQVDLGLAYRSLRQQDNSFDAFKKARDLAPTDPEVLFNLSLSYAERGDSGSARRIAAELFALHPQHPLTPRLRIVLPP